MNAIGLFKVSLLSASVSVGSRTQTLAAFTKGLIKVLICTDGLARGMDFPCVSTVINYQVPRVWTTYQHRAGRTARANAIGTVVTILDNSEVHGFKRMVKTLPQEMIITQSELSTYKEQYSNSLSFLQDTGSLMK